MRLNVSQERTLEALREAGRPLTAYEVLDALRRDRPTAAPPTAYRALEKLISLNLVHRIESINAYVACCMDHQDDAPLFAICDNCGAVDELADAGAMRTVTARAQAGGFSAEKSVVEVHGQCAECQRAP